MTIIKLKGINRVRKRLANEKYKTYYYHRATGTLLPGSPGSAEFLEAYKSADRAAPSDAGTITALIREYLASPPFAEPGPAARQRGKKRGLKPLKKSTQREYKRMLAAIESAQVPGETKKGKTFGKMPIAILASPRVIGKFIGYQEEIGVVSPREADNRLMTLSAVFSYALRRGRISRNPLLGFLRLYNGDRSEIVWTETDIRLFMEDASVEMQRAMILALHTGQRYGDLVRLRWTDYDGVRISLKQNKTGARVTVKVSAALKRMLDSTPKTCLYILARPDGQPWFTEKNDKEMGKAWRKRMEDAGLYRLDYLAKTRNNSEFDGERLHLHDVRGTAVTLLAEAGCTVPEIVSITGHTLENATKILDKYLARTQAISDAAILKFENALATGFANRLQTTATR